jgi:regulation of enolase protein 1 (concanavalin A-like superfamily)
LVNIKISILIVSVLIICLASEVGFVAAAAGYEDEFADSSLQPFWTSVDPLGDCSFNLVDHTGWLRITVPAATSTVTHALSPTSNLNAPRILQTITGDFIATTRATAGFSQGGFRGGLLLWVDGNNFIRLERHGGGYVIMYVFIGGTAQSSPQASVTENTVYLKLEKTGSTVKGSYSLDGAIWNALLWNDNPSCTFIAADPVQVGVFAINVYKESVFSADFDYFRILPHDVFVVPEYPLAIIGAPVELCSVRLVSLACSSEER